MRQLSLGYIDVADGGDDVPCGDIEARIGVGITVTVDETGRVVKCMQCLPKGLREVPVVTRILKREETGIIRGEIEVKS